MKRAIEMHGQCVATTRMGYRCGNAAYKNQVCVRHMDKPIKRAAPAAPTKPKRVEKPDFAATLDAAVHNQFPRGVRCSTTYNFFNMAFVSRWTDKRGRVLRPQKAREVRAFVQGFSAAWGVVR